MQILPVCFFSEFKNYTSLFFFEIIFTYHLISYKIDEHKSYLKLPPTYKANKKLANEISKLPKLNSSMLKILALINVTFCVFSFLGPSYASIALSALFLLSGILYLSRLWVLFIISMFATFFSLGSCVLYEKRKYVEMKFSFRDLIYINIFTILRIFIFAANLILPLPIFTNLNRILAYTVWFILPGIISAIVCRLSMKRRVALIFNYCICLCVILLALQYSSCKQTNASQVCYYTVYTEKEYFAIAVLSFFIFLVYSILLFKTYVIE